MFWCAMSITSCSRRDKERRSFNIYHCQARCLVNMDTQCGNLSSVVIRARTKRPQRQLLRCNTTESVLKTSVMGKQWTHRVSSVRGLTKCQVTPFLHCMMVNQDFSIQVCWLPQFHHFLVLGGWRRRAGEKGMRRAQTTGRNKLLG